jgi:hypothetical protein
MRRSYEIMELRLAKAEAGTKLGGYAAVFGSASRTLDDGTGPFVERIVPGAFAGSLDGKEDVKALLNHNTDIVLGSTAAGTLRLSEDQRGLGFELDLPDTSAGRDLAVSIGRGDIRGMSFGFITPKGGDQWTKASGEWVRTLRTVRLLDVSPTPYPAYQTTEVGFRSVLDVADDAGVLEAFRIARAEAEARQRRLRLLEKGA